MRRIARSNTRDVLYLRSAATCSYCTSRLSFGRERVAFPRKLSAHQRHGDSCQEYSGMAHECVVSLRGWWLWERCIEAWWRCCEERTHFWLRLAQLPTSCFVDHDDPLNAGHHNKIMTVVEAITEPRVLWTVTIASVIALLAYFTRRDAERAVDYTVPLPEECNHGWTGKVLDSPSLKVSARR